MTIMVSCDPVVRLAHQVVAEFFGSRVAKVVADLSSTRTKTLAQIVTSTRMSFSQVRSALVVLVTHSLVTTSSSTRRPHVVDYTIQLEKVIGLLRLPALISKIRSQYGERAETVLLQVVRLGQATASAIVFRAVKELKGTEKSSSVFDVYKDFKLLFELDLVKRVSLPSSESGEEPKHAEPDLKALALLLDNNTLPSMTDMADSAVFWKINTDTAAIMLRDKLIVEASTRRHDVGAGKVVSSLLHLVNTTSKDWAPVSSHIGHHVIVERVGAEHGKEEPAFKHLDQYLKLLSTERLVDRVGDAGGGQYCLDMEHISKKLAEASLDCMVLERFGSKALRIFRHVREKKFVEEGSLQGVVMIPTKETKDLTYQLMENHFLHLQELRKTLASNAPSKSFYLFYVNMDQVVRHCVTLCQKAIYNIGRRAELERAEHSRLLDRMEDLQAMLARYKAEGASSETLEEIEEQMTPTEKAAVEKVLKQLDKLTMARQQVAETLFILETYIFYRVAAS